MFNVWFGVLVIVVSLLELTGRIHGTVWFRDQVRLNTVNHPTYGSWVVELPLSPRADGSDGVVYGSTHINFIAPFVEPDS